jgi:1,4-dihydroxy-2-naphthoate octaprenyltransferase
LTVNNYRDRDEDAETGKRTLAVRFGTRFAHWEYRLALLLAVVAPVVLVVQHGERPGWLVPAALTLAALVPLQTALTRTAATDGAFGARMNRLLAATGRLELLYAITAAVAVRLW